MKPTRAQVSRNAIQRLYISMRHLFLRGYYKPLGMSGEAMIDAMLDLKPEIYGTIADPARVEIDGLLYIFQRLPQGVEECRFINLISREGFEKSAFKPIIPAKRRRNCYRIDPAQMKIEMTRGRSDIYDVLTHLTFLYIESEKIRRKALDGKDRPKREWIFLKEIHQKITEGKKFNVEVGFSYLSTLLGRTYEETAQAYAMFSKAKKVNNLFSIIYHLGSLSIDEHVHKNDREISFSNTLKEELGQHVFGTLWAEKIKAFIYEKGWTSRPIHIVSSNLHSVMNGMFAKPALGRTYGKKKLEEIAEVLSDSKHSKLRDKVRNYALKHGMHELYDNSGTNITVQLFDLENYDQKKLPNEIVPSAKSKMNNKAILLVMDYAFGEQAYECMDELLKPYEHENKKIPTNVVSINVMGKAGILKGGKGDIMIPNAHVFEGTADNYPFENQIATDVFDGSDLGIYYGPMVTVLGTSLQNEDILKYFLKSSWKVIGLEMEGAHYQKAIQSASKIRNSIKEDVVLRYAYYASDNPLHSGSTLASGGLGIDGVKPTYLITQSILKGILFK